MALEAIGGAALGAAFGELLKLVLDQTGKAVAFNKQLTQLETTLIQIQPLFTEITSKSPDAERITLIDLLEDGKKLVLKCSTIRSWNLITKSSHTNKLIDLDNNLLRFFQIQVPGRILSGVNVLLDRGGGSFRPCGVPGPPEFIVGLDQRLKELKSRLLKDETRVLVVSAPGGYGKTTLAKILCHDAEIKGIFGDNILYVTVAKETSLQRIAQDLFKHFGIDDYKFKSEEDAKNQIKNLLKQKGSGKKLLLVLDDVWSESVIRHLQFQIPDFKILVTSRSRYSFLGLNSTYDLSLLNAEDAEDLFCHYAFASDEIHVSDDHLVNKMIEFCKGMPLALTVVGGSLCGQPEIRWRVILKKWSEGRSILDSHQHLLDCLQTSIDALDEPHKNCFLDLGLFPEDEQIEGTILMDMWVELYNLDDEGMYASENLHDLKSRNLINLIARRKVAGEMEGHCSHYYVMQHDVLRDLAIHMNRQEPEAKRKRLSVEIRNNNFPEWWTKQPVDARILSISTDGEFSSTWDDLNAHFSSTWDDLNAPNVEVLILNIRSEKYSLPPFIEKMSQLKVLIVTGYGVYPTELDNLQVLASLSKLSRIRFEHVSVSPSIQVIFKLKRLKKLAFVMCKIGDALSNDATGTPYMLEDLKDFEIDLCYDLKELPAGLCSSVNLEKLIITNCQELDVLPIELGKLLDLEILVLHCCTKLKGLPESIVSLRKLSSIDVSDCSYITALPDQIGDISSLEAIDISGCEGLEELPTSLTKLKRLKNVMCDEERSNLWKRSDLCDEKINLVIEDRFATLKKICQ